MNYVVDHPCGEAKKWHRPTPPVPTTDNLQRHKRGHSTQHVTVTVPRRGGNIRSDTEIPPPPQYGDNRRRPLREKDRHPALHPGRACDPLLRPLRSFPSPITAATATTPPRNYSRCASAAGEREQPQPSRVRFSLQLKRGPCRSDTPRAVQQGKRDQRDRPDEAFPGRSSGGPPVNKGVICPYPAQLSNFSPSPFSS